MSILYKMKSKITFVISNSYSWKTKFVLTFIERMMGNLIVEYFTVALNNEFS